MVVPALATEWSASDDLLVWTFKLREGVKFSDGSDFDSEDVYTSWVAMWDAASPLHTGRTAEFTYFTSLFGGFLNAALKSDARALHTTGFSRAPTPSTSTRTTSPGHRARDSRCRRQPLGLGTIHRPRRLSGSRFPGRADCARDAHASTGPERFTRPEESGRRHHDHRRRDARYHDRDRAAVAHRCRPRSGATRTTSPICRIATIRIPSLERPIATSRRVRVGPLPSTSRSWPTSSSVISVMRARCRPRSQH